MKSLLIDKEKGNFELNSKGQINTKETFSNENQMRKYIEMADQLFN